jgi:hypothetical protein
MILKASMVVMSHLSDTQEQLSWELNRAEREDAIKRLNFAKFVILQTNGDLTQEIDADAMWDKFNETNKG